MRPWQLLVMACLLASGAAGVGAADARPAGGAGTVSAAAPGAGGAPFGRQLYHGLLPFAAGDAATSMRLPVELAACARCHGGAGEGTREGGVVAPSLRWRALTRTRDGLAAFGSTDAVLAAIERGVGRDGQALSAAMPRFTLQPDEARALLAYLERVGSRDDGPAGVDATTVRLGTILPLSGPAARIGQSLLVGLQAPIAAVNAAGGVHGRQIRLVVQDSAAGAAEALRALQARPVFALLGGLWNEDAAQLDPALAAAHLSHIAGWAGRARTPAAQGWSADLMPPRVRQHAALGQALQACANGPALAVASGLDASAGTTAGTQAGTTAVDQAVDTADPHPATAVRWIDAQAPLDAQRFQAAQGCVGYTLEAAARVDRKLPHGWSRTMLLPFPAALLDGSTPDLWARLGALSAQLGIELLGRAGVSLHERSLLDALDRLSGFELPAGVPLQFGRGRRYGWDPQLLQIRTAPATLLSRGDPR
jgi:cytochrome c553